MAYIGGLQKNEFSAWLQCEMTPLLEEVKALRIEVADLKNQLQHKGKDLYTIKDLEELFGVSRATIHNWVKEGKLIKHKIGGRTEFKRLDVEKLINYSKQ